MHFTTKIGLVALASFISVLAQPPVAPTPEPVGNPRGDAWDDYNITNSLELGYRFSTVGGDGDSYRSIVNYGDGIRLFGSSFSMNSKDGHGHYFDELTITTQGLGNDPYESAALRIAKNGLYRYDLLWRENEYFNPGLVTGGAQGQHLLDTVYTSQDQDLTLFPQSNLKFFLGYSRTHQDGPALSTVQLFNSSGNEFPLFENVRRVTNEYRLGNEFSIFGIRVNWMHAWYDFKEDSDYNSGPNLGNNPGNPTTLTSFQRTEPYHGTSPYWRVGVFSDKRHFSVNGRFTYTSGKRDFVLDETAFGTARIGEANQQIVTAGDANRPSATGNLVLSFYPTSKLTIVNSTSAYNTRIDGNSEFLQFNDATQSTDVLYFQYLGIRTIANETDVNYQPAQTIGFYAGYNYTNRRIRSIEEETALGSPQAVDVSQTNRLNSGTAGIRLRPISGLTVMLEGEIGRADTPFTPIADANYEVFGGRILYKLKNFTFSAQSRANYNVNSVSLSTYGSHARTYSGNVTWTPRERFSLDAGYSKLHLNTVGGIAYFAEGQFVQGEQSYFFSNIHAANLGVRIALTPRASLYVGYSHVQDTGDGRSTPDGAGIGSALPAFQAAQTFPLTYQSPMARLSIRITERIRWNAGYQYYGYREQFYPAQDFRANTGYTSILWSF